MTRLFFENRQIFNVNYVEINIDYFDFIFNFTHYQKLQTFLVQVRIFRTIRIFINVDFQIDLKVKIVLSM